VAGAVAAYGGALADAVTRDSPHATAFAPAAGLGTVLFVVALVRGGRALGWALGIAGAIYVGAIVAAGRRADATAPLVAVLLLLAGELAAWSFDLRLRLLAEDALAWRRAAAVAALALAGLGASALTLSLAAASGGHGLAWTIAGAAAAVGAAGAGVWLTPRHQRR
jgi:hypothetical protein